MRFGLLMGLTLLFQGAMGQILINEFSASNSTQIENTLYHDYSDWIELYNAGSSGLNLKGYYLTDDFDIPNKWWISDDVIIEAGGYMLIWADGNSIGLHTSYRLSSLGEEIGLYSPGIILVDSVSFSEQKTDISYGRIEDGHTDWGYFQQATPNAANTTEASLNFISSIPEFSMRGGFYSSPLTIDLSTDHGGEIRFTLDGSEPDENSMIYSSAVSVSSTTILRARIFKVGQIPGPTATHSYFINENSVDSKLPLVSIASAPENFWDPDLGIYVQGYKPPWDIPINIELFENNGSDRAAFNELAGTKVNGLYSWKLPQKMLGIYFKKQYGSRNLDYPILHQRKRDRYKSFALRASGSDWSYTLFRDMLGQHATLFNMDIDVMSFRPAVVYFNGEYMGIHNIREKVDDDYIEKSYQIESGSFDLVENQNFAEAGDLVAYNDLLNLLNQDLSVEANYNAVADLVDIENFTDYVITEMAVGNTSIDHNVMAWKPKEYGKWKWILMDVDRGFFRPTSNLISFYISKDVLLLDELIRNSTYKSYFARRLAGQLYTSFHAPRMKKLIDEHRSDIEAEIPRHIERWEGATSSYGNALPSVDYWQRKVCDLNSFAQVRPYALLTDLQNYNYQGLANLVLATYPENAGVLKIDQLEVPGSFCFGPFLKEIPAQILAENRPGYEFVGWSESPKQTLVARGATWKYLDTGIDPGTQWTAPDYDDTTWQSGGAPLGYGDGDETTVVGYGGDDRNKYITTYFRKSFILTDEENQMGHFLVDVMFDDGAIIYVNGIEIARPNMSCGNANYRSTSNASIGSKLEPVYFSFEVDSSLLQAGENVMAVEIHQNEPTSSDISFDLELSGYQPDNKNIVSNDIKYTLSLYEDRYLTAVYDATSNCIIPEFISDDITLSADCSPYLAQGDVTIAGDATLTIDAGVEILMPEGASFHIQGAIHANGTLDNKVIIKLNPDYQSGSWGILSFQNTTHESVLKHVTIEDASMGEDPVLEKAAISAFNANLILDYLVLEKIQGNPVLARYSDITLTNSKLHSDISGDLINVKYGSAIIEDCEFIGNDQPDTDAIDYDDVQNGIIRNCRIYDFLGFNSDAIDIGEKASNVLIDSIVVYNITDKGVSVGQRSSTTIQHSVFINCNMGVGVKDSGHAMINQCLFFNNSYPVASFEKNLGFAGGNIRVTNSILSNSSGATAYVDSKSTLGISHSLSDNEILPGPAPNVYGNPLFNKPSYFDFELQPLSPGILAGLNDGVAVDMGIYLPEISFEPPVMIYEIFVNPDDLFFPEFISLYNPSPKEVDLSNYAITKGVTATIPENTLLASGEKMYLTSDASSFLWQQQSKRVIQWESGQLSNNGEALQLEDSHGIVLDYLVYEDNGAWPSQGFSGEGVFQLINPDLDNHFPESWRADLVNQVVSNDLKLSPAFVKVYPNPTSERITIEGLHFENRRVEIYNLNGQMVGAVTLNDEGLATVDLSVYHSNILLIKLDNHVEKVVVIK